MPVEEKRSAEQIGTLGSCLIEGDSEQKSRERKTKRRALTLSIALQSLAIVALVVTPLLATPEKLPFNWFTPIPQYYHSSVERVQTARPTGPIRRECVVCFNGDLSAHPAVRSDARRPEGPAGDVNLGPNTGPTQDGLNVFDTRNQPPPPEDLDKSKKRRIVVGGEVQGAMLMRRVDPQYPPLARQLRHSGQVHIRAIISTEGNIESLQVLDGDPLLVQSAKDAVLQWHYRPTSLNGVPVEVETIITVVYTLNQ